MKPFKLITTIAVVVNYEIARDRLTILVKIRKPKAQLLVFHDFNYYMALITLILDSRYLPTEKMNSHTNTSSYSIQSAPSISVTFGSYQLGSIGASEKYHSCSHFASDILTIEGDDCASIFLEMLALQRISQSFRLGISRRRWQHIFL